MLDDESANSQVDLSNPQLGGYNIEPVDLQFAGETYLTITGAVPGGSTVQDGRTRDIYTLGAEGSPMIDDAINVTI